MKSNELPGTFNGPAEVRLVRVLPGPIERVWEYLVDPEKRARWLAGGPMEQRLGGAFTFHFKHKNLAPDETPPEQHKCNHEHGVAMHGTITHWEPPRRLGFTFGSDQESRVVIELLPQGDKVQLVVTHRATAGDIPFITSFATGWHVHFSLLIALLDDRPRPPFWPEFTRLTEEYERLRPASG